jgi:hypothetical protein
LYVYVYVKRSDHWPLLLRLTDVELDNLPIVEDEELRRQEEAAKQAAEVRGER